MFCGGLLIAAGCSLDQDVGTPVTPGRPGPALPGADKDGSEVLGPPSVPVLGGSGLSQGGACLASVTSAEVVVNVPAGAQVKQVFAYWAGGALAEAGDGQIKLNGIPVQGQLIGGPIDFIWWLGPWYFSAYRADVTDLNLVNAGANTLTVSEFNDTIVPGDKNGGISVVAVWDDGTPADIALRDGMDTAFFGYTGVLEPTEPQVFTFEPASAARVADLVILAASVGDHRPNRVRVTTSAGIQDFDNVLGGTGNDLWDSLSLPVDVPAGETSVTVELVSTYAQATLGATLGWTCAALSVPRQRVEIVRYDAPGVVFIDADLDGIQDPTEPGQPDVTVLLSQPGSETSATAISGPDGRFTFNVPAGTYTMEIPSDGPSGSFNPELAASFTATGALSRVVTVGPETPTEFFGFVPDAAGILDRIRSGDLQTDGYTRTTWRRLFRCAIQNEEDREPEGEGGGDDDDDDGPDGRGGSRIRDRDGHGGEHPPDDGCNCNPDSLRYNGDELRGLLATVQTLFLSGPFTFTEGRELQEAYRFLSRHYTTDEDKLAQELLVTELNYVAGRGIVAHGALVGALSAWSEALLASAPDAAAVPEKSRASDIEAALLLLKAVNTGGGGGGIE
jgi:hypothetical protein